MQGKVKDYVFVCKYKHKRVMHDPDPLNSVDISM